MYHFYWQRYVIKKGRRKFPLPNHTEHHAVKEMHADQSQGEKITPVLFEEMDGVWLHMQDSNHKNLENC